MSGLQVKLSEHSPDAKLDHHLEDCLHERLNSCDVLVVVIPLGFPTRSLLDQVDNEGQGEVLRPELEHQSYSSPRLIPSGGEGALEIGSSSEEKVDDDGESNKSRPGARAAEVGGGELNAEVDGAKAVHRGEDDVGEDQQNHF